MYVVDARSGAGHEARARRDEQEEQHRKEEEHAGQQQLQPVASHLEHDRRDTPEADEPAARIPERIAMPSHGSRVVTAQFSPPAPTSSLLQNAPTIA